MSNNNSVLVPSIMGFVSTSIDDFAVMLIYFAQAKLMDNPRDGYVKVITAQTIAFTAVMIVSLIGIILQVVDIPMSYIDLIGILPLLIGIVQCYETCFCDDDSHNNIINSINGERYLDLSADIEEDDYLKYTMESPKWFEEENITLINEGVGGRSIQRTPSPGLGPLAHNGHGHGHANSEVGINSRYTTPIQEKTCLDKFFDPFTFEVLVFALVCSCDNIAIYVAMFAAMKYWEIIVIVVLFYVLLAIVILISIVICQYGPLVNCFARHSKIVVPVLFVGLGVYILSHSVLMMFTPWTNRLAS